MRALGMTHRELASVAAGEGLGMALAGTLQGLAAGVWLGWLPGPCWVAGAAVSMEVFAIASGEAGLVRQYKQVLGIFRSLPIEQN